MFAEHLFSALSSACVPATLFVSVSSDKCCLMCGITAVWLTSDAGVKESPASSAQRHDSLRLMVLCVLTDPLSFAASWSTLEYMWYSVLVHVLGTQMVVDVRYSGYRPVVV